MDDPYLRAYFIRRKRYLRKRELNALLEARMLRRASEKRKEAEEERKRKLEDVETLEQAATSSTVRSLLYYKTGINVNGVRRPIPPIVEDEIEELAKEWKSDRGSEAKDSPQRREGTAARVGKPQPPGRTLRIVR